MDKNNGSTCTDQIIGGIIDVPNHDDGGGDVSNHHVAGGGCGGGSGDCDDSTCKSELTWDDSVRQQQSTGPTHQEQRQPHSSTRRLHPFPWSTPDENDRVPDNNLHKAEQMEYSYGSTDAAAATNDTSDRPLRRSSLVANESTLAASWFAARGMMSTDSFERYEEEMKQNVIREASSNNLEALASSAMNKSRHRQSRRASTGMSALHNEHFFVIEGIPSPSKRDLSSHKKSKHRVQKSLSLDDGLDQLVTSFISSFQDGDERRNRTSAHLIQSKLKKSDGQLEMGGSSELRSGLSSEELQLLTKMMRRLSNAGSDRSSEQQERCNDDLLNSDTWDSTNRISSTDTLLRSNFHPKLKNSSKESMFETVSDQIFPVPSRAFDAFGSFEESEAVFSSKPEGNDDDSVSRLPSSNLSTQVLAVPALERDETTSTLLSARSSLKSPPTKGQPAMSRPYPYLQRKETTDSETASYHTTKMDRNESLDSRFLKMPILGRDQSNGSSSIRIESKSSQERSRTISETALQTSLERGDSLSTNFSERNSTIPMPPQLGRFQSTNTTGAVVSETDDFMCTMEEFDDEVKRQKQMSGYQIGSPLSPTSHSLAPSRDSFSPTGFIAGNSSSALFSATLADLEGPPLKQDCGDLLAEGSEHLSMAMLVNIYGKLREMSLLGHVSVKLRDIDVNSHQYKSRKKELKRLGRWTAADEAKGYLDTTRKAGFIVRAVMDEHELFEADHARGANNDINQSLLTYDASLLKDFKTWVEESRVKQLDSATEGIIKRIREECSQRQVAREEKLATINSLPASRKADSSLCIARRRGSLLNVSESFQGASWMQQERKLIEDHFGVKNDLPASRRRSMSRDRLSPSAELSGSLITKAIEESSDSFFEEGSVMRNLLESGFEVVWFADRHPRDIIYGICVNRQTATVTVVFRGQEGFFDLFRKAAMSRFPNPIAHEDYEGNSECINLRSAVADEMLRVRMDTKMSLISEIREKVVIIGQELTKGDGYHLSVVGHSRGGGYATVLGYYLASSNILQLASAMRVFTFASSPVGCANFQKGFKHLEEEGRLMHARFANSNDLSSFLPIQGYCEETNSNEKYLHVGLQVRLHKANEAGRCRIKQSLDVSYDAKEPLLQEIARAAINMIWLIRVLFCFTYSKNHCISQYHLRMHFAREYRLALSDGVLRFDRKRKCLKSLNEYYIMKCRHVHDYTGFKEKGKFVPTWVVIILVACLLYVQTDILLKFSAGW